MKFEQYSWSALGITAQAAYYNSASADGICETHVILHVEPQGQGFVAQAQRLCQSLSLLAHQPDLRQSRPIFGRFFLSDATNQTDSLRQLLLQSEDSLPGLKDCALSYIQQPPLDGSKVALWLYLQQGSDITCQQGFTKASHNGYCHLYQWGLSTPVGDSYQQTHTLLSQYIEQLQLQGATLADHCIRTWFYVRDVDTQYSGLVKARRELFSEQGLNEHTHYIASTGIGGLPTHPHAIVQLDTYALLGLNPEQQRYLYAPTHLNPTYEYGVTFERGTVIEYGDRAEVYISGTASINNRGEVMHIGDVVLQTQRMLENVSTLLAEADSTFADVAQVIVYLRDISDYATVKDLILQHFPQTPCVITLAPVCRPTWLIEMECIAIPSRHNPQYPVL